jgi:type I restriction enzyme S subunit
MRSIWSEVRLEDASAIYLSSVDKHVVPGEADVRLCNYLDVYRNRRLTKGMRFSEGSATLVEIARFTLRKGDLVITKDSETPDDIGIPALVVDDLGGAVCGYHLAIVRPRAGSVSPDFLLHYLQSDTTKRHFLRTAAGLTRFGLSIRAISSLPVSIAPLREQAAIAGILDAVDMALERAMAAVGRARGVKDAVLQHFFYEAMGATAYADRPRKKLPPGWSLVETGDLLCEDPKNGVSPETSSHPPGVPTFSIAAVRDGHVDLANPDNLKYARLPEHVAHKFLLRGGDILVVRGNANPDLVGRAGVVAAAPDGCIYPDIVKRIAFRTDAKKRVLPEFGALAWNHSIIHNQILRRAKTSNGTLKINNRDVKQIVMPVPPEAEQAMLVRITSAVEADLLALKSAESAYRQLKRALMHDLLTGRVRVKSLDEAVAA